MNTLPFPLRAFAVGAVVVVAGIAGPWGAAPARAQQVSDNVVIVLDASGSMDDALAGTGVKKMDAAKAALKTVLTRVPADTHIGLLVFSGANVSNEWIYPLGPRDDIRLAAAIDQPRGAGGTPLGQFIKKGADRLLAQRAAQYGYGTFRLLIVTDGEAQDGALVDRYTPEVIARGITVDVIGVGMKQDHTLAKKVHSYRAANDPAALQRAVTEVLAEVTRSRDDSASADAFELLAPIPNEIAAAALQALSTSGNQPIGGEPHAAQSATTKVKSAPAAPPPAPKSKSPGRRNKDYIPVIFGVIIVIVIIRALRRRTRK